MSSRTQKSPLVFTSATYDCHDLDDWETSQSSQEERVWNHINTLRSPQSELFIFPFFFSQLGSEMVNHKWHR